MRMCNVEALTATAASGNNILSHTNPTMIKLA